MHEELVRGVLAGETRAIARAMRHIDDRLTGFRDALRALYPHTGRAHVIGITGNPGVGKSTIVDRLISALRADGGRVHDVVEDQVPLVQCVLGPGEVHGAAPVLPEQLGSVTGLGLGTCCCWRRWRDELGGHMFVLSI